LGTARRLDVLGGLLTLALLVPWPAQASTEWQIRPFAALTFDGSTTLLDLENAAGHPHVVAGIGGALLGDILGIEVDLGYAPGFFQHGNLHLVARSEVTTFTGNVVVGVPRHKTTYTLRPYLVGGFGLMHVTSDDALNLFPVNATLRAFDAGGGVTGFLSNRIGVSWELRHFRSFDGSVDPLAISLLPQQLSFWRASMALVIRY
jgi:hypothetical protein